MQQLDDTVVVVHEHCQAKVKAKPRGRKYDGVVAYYDVKIPRHCDVCGIPFKKEAVM